MMGYCIGICSSPMKSTKAATTFADLSLTQRKRGKMLLVLSFETLK